MAAISRSLLPGVRRNSASLRSGIVVPLGRASTLVIAERQRSSAPSGSHGHARVSVGAIPTDAAVSSEDCSIVAELRTKCGGQSKPDWWTLADAMGELRN